MEARLTNDPKIEVSTKRVGYWGQERLSWHLGIFWGPYWFAETEGLRSDHGGQAHKWSWDRGQYKTSVLLRPGTSKFHVGIIWGPYWFARTGGLRSALGGQVHKWSRNRVQKDSEVTMEARFTNNPEIEVRTKLVRYWCQALLSWYVGIIWGPHWFVKTRGLRSDHGGLAHKWSSNREIDLLYMASKWVFSILKINFLDHDHSVPLLGHPKMYFTSWDPISKLESAFERQENLKLWNILKLILF